MKLMEYSTFKVKNMSREELNQYLSDVVPNIGDVAHLREPILLETDNRTAYSISHELGKWGPTIFVNTSRQIGGLAIPITSMSDQELRLLVSYL